MFVPPSRARTERDLSSHDGGHDGGQRPRLAGGAAGVAMSQSGRSPGSDGTSELEQNDTGAKFLPQAHARAREFAFPMRTHAGNWPTILFRAYLWGRHRFWTQAEFVVRPLGGDASSTGRTDAHPTSVIPMPPPRRGPKSCLARLFLRKSPEGVPDSILAHLWRRFVGRV